MINWLRRVTPDLFLAAVVALLITLALDKLDTIESDRIVGGVRWAARDGLTIDERIGVFEQFIRRSIFVHQRAAIGVLEQSIRRSIFFHQPVLVAGAAIIVGFICRNRRWAWLTAIMAIVPALLMGAGFLVDCPPPRFGRDGVLCDIGGLPRLPQRCRPKPIGPRSCA